jgi:hypothetical protein
MDLVPEFNASQCINADGSAIPISTKSSSSANAVTTNESKAASLTTTGLLVSLFALIATILAS